MLGGVHTINNVMDMPRMRTAAEENIPYQSAILAQRHYFTWLSQRPDTAELSQEYHSMREDRCERLIKDCSLKSVMK
jgi:hypothetical protein